MADVPLAFGQDCKALRARPGVEPLFLAFAVDALASEIQGMVEYASHGTGKLSTDRLKSLSVVVPPPEVQTAFVQIAAPMRDLMSALRLEQRCTLESRELLLPKLVTGRIDVDSLGVDDFFGWRELANSL